MLPTTGQIALLVFSIALFAVGGGISLFRLQRDRPRLRIAAKACMWSGVTVALAVLIWHSRARRSWLPLEDSFDSLIWLAVVLAVFVMYVQRRKPLGGLDWFVMPIVILLLVGAAISGLAKPQMYEVHNLWSWTHLAGVYGGAAAFAVAGAAGAMYLVTNYRLRRKVALAGPSLGSLERLEHLTLTAVTLGFALLTIGAIIGFMKMKLEHRPTPVSKVFLTAAVWVVFAVVLHSPMNPSFRGRRAALLSIVGFVLMIAAVIAVLVTPGE
jgi:ABC-type uncharacterized transport system permease subunit